MTILPGHVGLSDVPSGTASIINNVLSRTPEMEPPAVAMVFSGISILSRAVIVRFTYTTITFLVNKGKRNPLWVISKVKSNSLRASKVPAADLVSKVATKLVAPLVASVQEHLAIGKASSRKNNYATDESQELCYIGLANTVNSLFGTMGDGGAMSRTPVNSRKLKTPLSAIVIMAVIHTIGPASLFYRWWRTFFPDTKAIEDAILVSFTDPIFFPNAGRVKKAVLESVKVKFEPQTLAKQAQMKPSDRSWSVASTRRIKKLRGRGKVAPLTGKLAVVVWDMTRVPFVDVTGVQALAELREEVTQHFGHQMVLRLPGMNGKGRRQFARGLEGG
ncbi:Sulfate permease 1 [Colletotrichum orbiculare MAFF 240422]|uniref:Sulfate permease 1 n=1 Tax=Colletotrichum orbiculare (strain 104-T / ATCC 96160 / CBS 514.97 / LARS 414 / MAFF 240422) TaxID=1213857 RepID=A0A484FPR4_COLOR|nr:Sulfate permease 1 [Colletotrichum orbiculare MAFF 240422]